MSEQNSEKAKSLFFITGTDTGAGKTVASAALARCLMQTGGTVSMIKPFQTGCSGDIVSDADFVHRVTKKNFKPEVSSPYRLKEPLAPMFAAEIENSEFSIEKILKIVESEAATHDAVIVEGAGGLLVPIEKNYFMADFALDLGFKTIIVARAGLGTLNHTLLTVEAARARKLEIAGVVICGYPREEKMCEQRNLLFLNSAGQLTEKIVGIIPFFPGLDVESGKTGELDKKDCRLFFTSDLSGLLDEKEMPGGRKKTSI